jgi:hypothetical protein
LGSSHQEGRVVIQSSRGEDCDPVIKRGAGSQSSPLDDWISTLPS